MQTVSNILPYARQLVSVDSSATVQSIQTLMIAKEVSYIPIIDNRQRKNNGVVSRKKLWKWMLNNVGVQPNIEDVKEECLPEVIIKDTLSLAMEKLANAPAILVRNEEKKYTHLISPRVVATALKNYSEKFQLIEELEQSIRNLLQNLSRNDLSTALQLDHVTLDRMTFGDYQTVINKLWKNLPLNHLDRSTVNKLLTDTREYRNAIMHFHLVSDNVNQQSRSIQELLHLLR